MHQKHYVPVPEPSPPQYHSVPVPVKVTDPGKVREKFFFIVSMRLYIVLYIHKRCLSIMWHMLCVFMIEQRRNQRARICFRALPMYFPLE